MLPIYILTSRAPTLQPYVSGKNSADECSFPPHPTRPAQHLFRCNGARRKTAAMQVGNMICDSRATQWRADLWPERQCVELAAN